METTPAIISSARLDLIPLAPAFMEASLRGDHALAQRLLGLTIPADSVMKHSLLERRLGQLRAQPGLVPWLQPWLLRAMGLRGQRLMVGHIGFHTAPGPEYLRDIAPGAVEYGYTVYPPYRRQGFAREAAAALMRWAHREQQVARFVLTISPDNRPSVRLAESFGFARVGSHIDEVDGLEDIYLLDYIERLDMQAQSPRPEPESG